ncbi:hypothetical protein ACLBW0_23945 [Enterobacteriaceae bacterium C34A]
MDKITGKVISGLPGFNGNAKYCSTIDNGTPSPDLFDVEYCSTSSMMWISGQNIPKNGDREKVKCANSAYHFSDKNFIRLVSSRCEIDAGSDSDVDPHLH